jgi:hypothetical protein
MKTLRAGLVGIALASLMLSGCTDPNPAPSDSTSPVVSPSGGATPAPTAPQPTADATPGTLAERVAAGEVLVDIPAEWGEAKPGVQVDEGYILQDFTWTLSVEGTIASTVGLTQSQGQGLSGGDTFEDHVSGMVDVLSVEGTPAPTVTRSTIGGVETARIWAPLEDRDMLVVLYLYNLGDVYYEFGYFQASDEPNGGVLLARFDEVAVTLSTEP